MVIVAVPNWLLAGVTVRVRLVPEPPNTMLPLGINVGLLEVALTTRALAAVSTSLMVKAIGVVAVFWKTLWG